jgi:hypothetical protein
MIKNRANFLQNCMNKQIILSALLVMALFLMPGTSRARLYNVNTGRFQTMDTYEGSQEDPLSLHKYLYCHDNPVNGTDPSGQQDTMIELAVDEGFNALAQMPNLVSVGEVITPLSLGFWVVTKKDVNLSTTETINGVSPHGFMVVYHPGPIPNGTLIMYQTITPPSGAVDAYPHVDNTPPPHQAPTTGCRLPPPMTPLGDVPNSYIDTPSWGNGSALLPGTYEITAVAVSRLNCQDKILGRHYFEWDNRNRTISNESDNNNQQWLDSMGHWYKVPGD